MSNICHLRPFTCNAVLEFLNYNTTLASRKPIKIDEIVATLVSSCSPAAAPSGGLS